MMCQRIGRYPMFTIGLGIVSENSRNRIPWPPQKRTTFIGVPPFGHCADEERLPARDTKRRCGPAPLRVTSLASNPTFPKQRASLLLLFLQRADREEPQTMGLLKYRPT